MQVQLDPELEAKLKDIAAQRGQAVDELVGNVMAGYIDELAATRGMLDSRYDDIKDGKVKLVPGDEVFARLREKSEARRQNPVT